MVYFETPRLVVRSWERSDEDALYEILSDARVHRWTGDAPWTRERTRGYLDYMIGLDFRTLDSFHGACVQKSDSRLIGFTGLNPYLPDQPELEWQFGVPYWGMGYATETGRATLRNAFRSTGITAVWGMAHPGNTASMHALEKIGMTGLGLREFHGHMDRFYRILRQDAQTPPSGP